MRITGCCWVDWVTHLIPHRLEGAISSPSFGLDTFPGNPSQTWFRIQPRMGPAWLNVPEPIWGVPTVSHAFFLCPPPPPPYGGGAGQGLATFSKGEWVKNKAKFFFGACGAYGS